MIKNRKVITGVVVAGHQVASGRGASSPYPESSLKLQSPHFLARGLDISVYYQGTLNISIAPHQVKQVNGRYRFDYVEWTHLHPPETFSFSPCELIFSQQTHPALVYYPHPETKKTHFQHVSILEVLTTYVADIHYGSGVQLAINAEEVILATSSSNPLSIQV